MKKNKKLAKVEEKAAPVQECKKADDSKKCNICATLKEKAQQIKISPELKTKVTTFVKKNSTVLIAVASTFVVTAFLGKVSADKRVNKARRRR